MSNRGNDLTEWENVSNSLIGRVVRARAGRDKNEFYVIVSDFGKGIVGVADGKTRTIAHPKRKNIRHLFVTKAKIVEVSRLLGDKGVSSNLKLRAILEALERG